MSHYLPPPPNYAPKPTMVLRWYRAREYTYDHNNKERLSIRLILQQWWHDPAVDHGEWRPISEED